MSRRQPERTTTARGDAEAATPAVPQTGYDIDPDTPRPGDTSGHIPPDREPGAAERTFATAWAIAVSDTSDVPLDRPEVEAYLAGLTTRLATLLTAEPFHPEAAADVGGEMIDTHFTGPGTLGRTI